MNEFTKGEWSVKFRNNNEIQTTFVGVVIGDRFIDLGFNNEEDISNAHLIATAGTTANKLAEQSYNAVKVLEVLPEILALVEKLESLEKIKGKYLSTWRNGTEEYAPSHYKHEDVEALNLRAFDLLEQCRGE